MEFPKLVVLLIVFAMIIHVTNSGNSGKGKGKGNCNVKKEWGKSKGLRMSSKVDCELQGLPPSPNNGNVTGTQYLQDDVVTYSCHEGYVLEGENKSTCQIDGSWTNVNSTKCRADCAGLPPSPTKGKVTGTQYLQDDVVTYSCDEGYVLEGEKTSTCQNDRSWTNVNSTKCRADCEGLPPSPTRGKVTGTQYLQDDVVTYSCDEGYVLEGEKTSTCQNDRSWTNVNSTKCRADCEGLPPSPTRGNVTGTQYLQDDVVTYSCDEGYVLEGEKTSTCQNDRSWTNVNSTKCRADCEGLPPSPTRGNVTGTQYLQDDVVTYSCDEGYVLEGEKTSTCQNDRSWTNVNSTKCRADCEGLPTSPTRGNVTGTQYLQDDVVTYSCDEGYVLEGEKTSTCQNDRSWTNVNSTKCRADCEGLPPSPTKGKATGTQFLQDDVVTYSCDESYVLDGEETSTCQNDGSWTNVNSTKCRQGCAGLPPPPTNGYVTGTTFQDDVATYSCKDGFLFEGEGTSTCQKDGQWDNINSTNCLEICGERGDEPLQAGKHRNFLVSHSNYGNQDYEDFTLCFSLIEARPGYTINFTFNAMEIENYNNMTIGHNKCADSVAVRDGNYDDYDANQPKGLYCGSKVPPAILSTGQYLIVRFETDEEYVFKGFSAEYKEVETAVQSINTTE